MNFKALVKQAQRYSGFSAEESKDALEMMVESIAVRLEEEDRRNFAAQLPGLLSDIALSVLPSKDNSEGDLINQFIAYEHIDEHRARQQIKAAWRTLQHNISKSQVKLIRSQLSSSSGLLLT